MLVEAAKRRTTLYYGEVAAQLNLKCRQPGPRWRADDRRLFQLLGRISEAEVERNRPMLSAVVVRVGEAGPGMGFFTLARRLGREFHNNALGRAEFWLSELRKVYDTHGADQSTD